MPFITQGKTNWKFILIVIIVSIIVGGWILFVLTLPIPPSWQPPPKIDEKHCEKDSDCVLNYTGSETCPSCLSDDYQCVSLEYYNKVLWPEWEKNHKGILCEGCPMVTDKLQCICEKSLCKKIVKDETADWKTYRDEEYGYELKYPKGWVLDEKIKETVTLNSPENEKIMKDIIISYYSSVSEEPENKTNKFGAVTIDELIQKDKLITPLGQITFAGEKAYEVIWGGFGTYYSILIEKNNHLYIITFGNRENKSKLTEIDNQILSTFRFLDGTLKEKIFNATNSEAFFLTELQKELHSESEEAPEDLKIIVIEDMKKGNEWMLLCEGKNEITAADFQFSSESIDLNEDGVKEFIIGPGGICDNNSLRGAQGNGSYIIYQKINNAWKDVGVMWGNYWTAKIEKTNDYHDIITYAHMSAASGIVTLYQWNKTELKYEEIISKELNSEQ